MDKFTTIKITVNANNMETCPLTGQVLYSEVKKWLTKEIAEDNFSFSFTTETTEVAQCYLTSIRR